jgi:hypothetical protein
MKHVVIVLLLSLGMIKASAEEKINPLSSTNTALDYDSATTLGIIRNKELIELSGVVAGGANRDILWVHNDRGNLPRLYALNMKGETVGTYCLDAFNDSGTMSGDWEDIGRMPGLEKGKFELYVGDIGNNAMAQKEHRILVVSEPIVDTNESSQVTKTEFKTIRFRYPEDYICNSECLLINPVTREIFIISKSVNKGNQKVAGNHAWSIPAVKDYSKIHTAKLEMDSIPAIKKDKVTGGDISSDGQFLILRTNKETAYLWQLKEDQALKMALSRSPKQISLAKEKGGEAICFALDHSKLFTVYDGKKEARPLHTYLKKFGNINLNNYLQRK